jgi:glyoxylase-like metal-dependent hydrolase (beta-lactamase superfamily II)
MAASIEHMRELGATTVYPGHGAPFSMSEVAKA